MVLNNKKKVLFICVHNSARSQMAEAFLKQSASAAIEVESAGLEPGVLNPLVVEVMQEAGIDIAHNKTQSVFDLHKKGRSYDYVITVCDESQSEKCPIFPGSAQKLHWPFDDPSRFEGSMEDKKQKTRIVRDSIKKKIHDWVQNKSL